MFFFDGFFSSARRYIAREIFCRLFGIHIWLQFSIRLHFEVATIQRNFRPYKRNERSFKFKLNFAINFSVLFYRFLAISSAILDALNAFCKNGNEWERWTLIARRRRMMRSQFATAARLHRLMVGSHERKWMESKRGIFAKCARWSSTSSSSSNNSNNKLACMPCNSRLRFSHQIIATEQMHRANGRERECKNVQRASRHVKSIRLRRCNGTNGICNYLMSPFMTNNFN